MLFVVVVADAAIAAVVANAFLNTAAVAGVGPVVADAFPAADAAAIAGAIAMVIADFAVSRCLRWS